MLLLVKRHTDTLIKQTRKRPQVTPEFKMNKQKETISFSPPINLIEEGKWLFGVNSFEANNFVFNITDENNSFSISIPGCWRSPNYLEDGVCDKINNILKFKSQNHIEQGKKWHSERADLAKALDITSINWHHNMNLFRNTGGINRRSPKNF